MAARQPSKQTKTKAEAQVDTGVTNQPVGNRKREPQSRNPRVRSRAAAAQNSRAAATAVADVAVVRDKAEPTRSSSKPTSRRADLRAGSVSCADQLASTKRAKLIAMLERPEGASVAEIGQRLGWLPHTVRAAITGLRKAGREVTRSKNANDRSVYRLGPVEPASQR